MEFTKISAYNHPPLQELQWTWNDCGEREREKDNE